MIIKTVDPKEVRWPPVRLTSYMSAEATALFRSSMEAQGQVEPILVLETKTGLVGVDGYNRTMDALARGSTQITAVVVPGEERDAYLQNLATAFMRGRPKPTELVGVIKELTHGHGMDSDQIAAATGMTRDYVEKIWTIAEANPEILQALDEGLFGVTVAYMLARIPDQDMQLRVLDQQKVQRWNAQQLGEHIKQVMAIQKVPAVATAPSRPSSPARVTCQYCGGEYAAFLVAYPPTCVECSADLHAAIRQSKVPHG